MEYEIPDLGCEAVKVSQSEQGTRVSARVTNHGAGVYSGSVSVGFYVDEVNIGFKNVNFNTNSKEDRILFTKK